VASLTINPGSYHNFMKVSTSENTRGRRRRSRSSTRRSRRSSRRRRRRSAVVLGGGGIEYLCMLAMDTK